MHKIKHREGSIGPLPFFFFFFSLFQTLQGGSALESPWLTRRDRSEASFLTRYIQNAHLIDDRLILTRGRMWLSADPVSLFFGKQRANFSANNSTVACSVGPRKLFRFGGNVGQLRAANLCCEYRLTAAVAWIFFIKAGFQLFVCEVCLYLSRIFFFIIVLHFL